jgi:putative drug exporter of the RND superfamily
VSRLAQLCFDHRRRVVVFWLLAAVVLLGVSRAAGSEFNAALSLPNTDSQAAVSLLSQHFPAAAGEGDQVVIQAINGATISSAPVRAAVTSALAKVAKVPGVASVDSPYASNGAGQISRDGAIAFARVSWDAQPANITTADADRLITAAQSGDGAKIRVSLEGESITNTERPTLGASVVVGIIAALIILLIVFGGAVLASLLPLAGTAVALVIGLSLVRLLTHVFDVASQSIDLAVLIGLGVGVDYGLFIVSRHRSAVKAGRSYRDAAAEAVDTSGRTVLFAGAIVCLALLGQCALGVNFLYGPSVAAALAVSLTMASSLTFLPALLGFLGPRLLSRKERVALEAGGTVSAGPAGFGLRWARFVEAHRALVAFGALAIVVVIALPTLGLRLGTSDAGTDPSSSTTHQAYVTLADGFGPGFNGPLQLAGRVSSPADTEAFAHLLSVVADTSGVASVTRPITSPDGDAVVATVNPTTSPQDPRTVALVGDLRDQLIPRAERGTSLEVHVGGETATNIDFSHVLGDKLPLFIAFVVLLAFVLLAAVFRSLLVPLVASLLNLLSVGAALGAVNAVFNWGWGASVLGLTGTGPLDAFLPVIMFSVLFGLSMDYEVFTVSRMHEEWRRLHDDDLGTGRAGQESRRNHLAVTLGQAKSTRIIIAAAGIMVLVFGSFLIGGHRLLQEFGFGLAFAVLIDALIIRSLLLPAVMHLVGPANWALPNWLGRKLPRFDIETNGPSDDEVDRPVDAVRASSGSAE